MLKNWKLLERSIELVVLYFGSHASDIELTEAFDIYVYRRPGISVMDEFQCFILFKMTCKNVIVVIL